MKSLLSSALADVASAKTQVAVMHAVADKGLMVPPHPLQPRALGSHSRQQKRPGKPDLPAAIASTSVVNGIACNVGLIDI